MFEVLLDQASVSLGQQLLMTSTQEPNTMVPQSALCICLRKLKAKLVVPTYFGTKMSKFSFTFKNHFFLVTGIRVLVAEVSKINFNGQVWQLWIELTVLELWEQFAIFQVMTGKTSLQNLRKSCLYVRNGKLQSWTKVVETLSEKDPFRSTSEFFNV